MDALFSQTLAGDFIAAREYSVKVCASLETEDYGLQAEPFVSPPKWHLAHTTWFFETFLLKPYVEGYKPFHADFEVLFNSYYNAIGAQFPRPQRGLLSRPTVSQVLDYRRHVNDAMTRLLAAQHHPERQAIETRCRLGIEHEKQHQELFFTDIKYSFWANPLYPALQSNAPAPVANPRETRWCDYPGGLFEMGVDPERAEFVFDNETPAHKVFLEPFSLADRLVTNGEYQSFIEDGGYANPVHWLADGWVTVQQQQWTKPLYWLDREGKAMEFTLYGLRERRDDQPVCHLSGYEADAFANWARARLPTEAEWEFAARQQAFDDNPASGLHPRAPAGEAPAGGLLQLYDSCWQWTASAYRPYPGFTAQPGAIGEYNGKFMSNQWVLRGGSCVTSSGHLRPTYRNFFYLHDRWQFSGIRLARNI